MARLEAAAPTGARAPGVPSAMLGDLAARVAAALARIDEALAGEE